MINDNKQRLFTIIGEHLALEDDEIILESTGEDLGADSLDGIELIMKIESEFKIEISNDIVETFKTVGDILNYLNTLN